MLIPLAPPHFWLVSVFLTLDPPELDAKCHKLVSSDSLSTAGLPVQGQQSVLHLNPSFQ